MSYTCTEILRNARIEWWYKGIPRLGMDRSSCYICKHIHNIKHRFTDTVDLVSLEANGIQACREIPHADITQLRPISLPSPIHILWVYVVCLSSQLIDFNFPHWHNCLCHHASSDYLLNILLHVFGTFLFYSISANPFSSP